MQCLNSRGSQRAAAEQCILLLQLCFFALGQTLVNHFPLPAEVVASRAMTSPWVAVSRSLNPALFKGIGLFRMVGCVIRVSQAHIPVVGAQRWSTDTAGKSEDSIALLLCWKWCLEAWAAVSYGKKRSRMVHTLFC